MRKILSAVAIALVLFTSSVFADNGQKRLFSAFGQQLVAEETLVAALHFPYNINTRHLEGGAVTLTGSGSSSHANSMAELNTTAAINSGARIASRNVLRYINGVGAVVKFTAVFDTCVAGNTQWVGVGDDNDALFFGCNGDTFSVNRRANGTDNISAQTSWNRRQLSGQDPGTNMVLNPQKGNVYAITYQWLGFGRITFSIEDQYTGKFEVVHAIDYANTSTTPSLFNPTLPLCIDNQNTTNDTAVTLRVASMGAFTQGKHHGVEVTNSHSQTLSATATEAAVFTIQNKSTFASITNRVSVAPTLLTLANSGNKDAIFRIVRGTTLGGSPSYSDKDTNTSVVSIDEAGTTLTGGVDLGDFAVSAGSQIVVNLNALVEEDHVKDVLRPGEILTVGAAITSAGTGDVTVGLVWKEQM